MAALAEHLEVGRLQKVPLAGLTFPFVLRLRNPLSDDELLKFCELNSDYQIERNADGELEIMSPTGWDGSGREDYVARMLGNWTDEHGGFSRGPTAAFKLGKTEMRSPDTCWIDSGRLVGFSAQAKKKFLPLCPDFLIEVLSESDSRRTLEDKMQMWINAGAKLAWMIDPYAGEVLVYRPGAEPERLKSPDYVEADSVVSGFRLETARMWEK